MVKEIVYAFCFAYGVYSLGRDLTKVILTIFFERN